MSRQNRRSSFSEQFGAEAKEESSLVWPLTIIGVTLLLSAGFLSYYFGPSLDELRGRAHDPTASQDLVNITIAGEEFRIPTNYTQFPKDRRPGEKTLVAFFALLPDFEPFSPARQEDFESNSADSAVIYFQLGVNAAAMTEADRFEKVYSDHIIDLEGSPADHNLTMYEFDSSPAYEDQQLFVHRGKDDKAVFIRCHTKSDMVPRPHCRRDAEFSDSLSVSYRYKRPWLRDWNAIDSRVFELIRSWKVVQEPES